MVKIDLNPLNLTKIDEVFNEGYLARRELYEELKTASNQENIQLIVEITKDIRNVETAIKDINFLIQQFNLATESNLKDIRIIRYAKRQQETFQKEQING